MRGDVGESMILKPSSPGALKNGKFKLRGTPPITLFAIPKAFSGHFDLIQRNAINSWIRLRPYADVLLMGDDDGTADAARELGVRHLPGIEVNEFGTPLVSSAFEMAQSASSSPILVYCNCDVIFLSDFIAAIEKLVNDPKMSSFVAFGRRTEVRVPGPINFDCNVEIDKLEKVCRDQGTPGPIVCKEYFVFSRDLYQQIPAFSVGRGNWDNWIVRSAKDNNVPVVNLSSTVTAVHQTHDYSHHPPGRLNCYVTGKEARENQRLAGGRHLISGSTADWRLAPHGVYRNRFGWAHTDFWADLPRFMKLLMNLLVAK
jgi:hypothetical protein